MVSLQRWKEAQKYEAGFWEAIAEEAARGVYDQLDFYEWRAGQLTERLKTAGVAHLLDGHARIVEIGSGPIGLAGYLPAVEKVAVDPLNDSYTRNPELVELRSPSVRYITAPGESVPLESHAYDLLIIENCIDHVQDIDGVMGEINRLLKEGGLLYLTVNARSRPGYWIHRLLARLALDPGHPHTFTARRARNLLRGVGFEILYFDAAPWKKAWTDDLRSTSMRGRMKAILFVSEHLVSMIGRKSSSWEGLQ